MIKSLYNDYSQKSRVFLYPLLGVQRGVSVTPICTYTSWVDHYDHTDYKLVCTYHIRDDKEFYMFEKSKLFGNPLFTDFYHPEDNRGMYIFNYEDFSKEWDKYLEGKYSTFTDEFKKIILSFFSKSRANYEYVDSYLNPHKYYDTYARLLNCDKSVLEQVVELCDKPDLDRETIDVKIKSLEIENIDLT